MPVGLTNAEREKVLGMAWNKAKLADDGKWARINSEQQRIRATPTPLPGGRAHGSTRVAWDHAPLTRNATHAPAPQPQLRAAPPAPQLVVGQEDPATPHWIKLAVTDGMLRVGLPPDDRPGQCLNPLIVNLPPGVAHGQTLRVHCQPPPAPCQPLLDPLLPPFPPMSLQTLLPPAAPPPAIAVPPKPRRRAPEPKRQPTPSASGLGFGPADDVDGGAVWYGGEEAFEELLGYALTSSPEG